MAYWRRPPLSFLPMAISSAFKLGRAITWQARVFFTQYFKNLGNLYADDSWRFIGRGFKQVTGRYNYSVTSTRMFGDDRLLDNPEILEQPEYAAMSAGEFWNWKGLNHYADRWDHVQLTKLITGSADQAFQRRVDQSLDYLRRIKNGPGKPDFSNVVSGANTKKAS